MLAQHRKGNAHYVLLTFTFGQPLGHTANYYFVSGDILFSMEKRMEDIVCGHFGEKYNHLDGNMS